MSAWKLMDIWIGTRCREKFNVFDLNDELILSMIFVMFVFCFCFKNNLFVIAAVNLRNQQDWLLSMTTKPLYFIRKFDSIKSSHRNKNEWKTHRERARAKKMLRYSLHSKERYGSDTEFYIFAGVVRLIA